MIKKLKERIEYLNDIKDPESDNKLDVMIENQILIMEALIEIKEEISVIPSKGTMRFGPG